MADNILQTIMQQMGFKIPEGPAPTPDQRKLYEEMAVREQVKRGPIARAVGGVLEGAPQFAKGFTVSDPNMPLGELQKTSPWEKGGMLMQAAPVSAITIFKDAFGVPSKMLRAASTQKFLDSAQTLAENIPGLVKSDNIYNAAEKLASKYPRVAAHLRLRSETPDDSTFLARAFTPWGRVEKPMDVEFSKIGAENAYDPNAAINTMFHEATHGAQALGDKRFSDLYEDARNVVGEYDNPYEQTARMIGGKAAGQGYREKRTKLHPDVVTYLQRVMQNRGLLRKTGHSLPTPEFVEQGFFHGADRPINHVLDSLNTTADDKALVGDIVRNMRKGYVDHSGAVVPPKHPDQYERITAMRLLRDAVNTKLQEPVKSGAVHRLDRAMKERKEP